MARKARIKSQTGIYHVLIRGNAHLDLFTDEEDATVYVTLLQDLINRGFCRIYAYSLHPTHIHLLIQEGSGSEDLTPNSSLLTPNSISSIVRRLASSFAYYYNVKYDHYGPIYQDRFKSQPVETRAFFLRVLDFILTQPLDPTFKGTLDTSIPSFTNEKEKESINPLSRINSSTADRLSPDLLIDYSPQKRRITDSLLLAYLQRHHSFTGIPEFLQLPPEEQNRIISDCKHHGGSVRQLVRLTGMPYLRVFQAK